jgi:hypothetical protein
VKARMVLEKILDDVPRSDDDLVSDLNGKADRD